MKKLLVIGFCLLFGLLLGTGCGGSGSAIPSGVPLQLVSPTPHASSTATSSSALTLVNPAPPPPTGNVGQNYFLDLSQYVQGGTGGISFALKSGALPSGLTLSAGISGIPTSVSATNVVVTAKDSGKPPSSVDVSILITINPMLPLIVSPSSGSLPDGIVGTSYNLHQVCYFWRFQRFCHWVSGFTLGASGGVVPTTFSWAAASAPPGLTLDPTSGLISGAPTTAGMYSFVATVTDSESPPKHVNANYTITVAPTPSPSPSPSSSP